jgi:voltage-gated potassium channel
LHFHPHPLNAKSTATDFDGDMETLKEKLRDLYESDTHEAHMFRYGLLAFDLLTIIYLVASSFLRWTGLEYIDTVIGVVLATDFLIRLWLAKNKRKHLMSPMGAVDIIVILSLLAPLVGEGAAFLRILRLLRIGRAYLLMRRLKHDFPFIRRNEQAFTASINMAVFVFIMTAIVYETQVNINSKINNYADALYFNITALTTTGFGDIVLEGTWGRMLSSIIMICGVSLFLRLIQTLLRPLKVEHKCPDCGLRRHDHDAVHCKACGLVLDIEDEGAV